jgi:tRNA (guanine-N7-)-methyltransferase
MTANLPKKGHFRQRAHSNPFSDHDLVYPPSPEQMNWLELYPKMAPELKPDMVDIGCGYGGLLVALAPAFPDHLILGLEIRQKVVDYVSQRIDALRQAGIQGVEYQNIAVRRSNSMKYLVNFCGRGQLSKAFILFPDPHFKRKKHKARIVTSNLLAEYAYCLRPQGRLYVATDVAELFGWMTGCIDKFPLFSRLPPEETAKDECVMLILSKTEESFKVEREGRGRSKQYAVYERVE